MAEIQKMRLEDWLDDLCVRFIINLPVEDLSSIEQICFQVEEAQWFYEDFIRPTDPSLPSLNLKGFCLRVFQHCPILTGYSPDDIATVFTAFLEYKTRVPVRGAILLNDTMDKVVLVKGWKKGACWSFPRGKLCHAEPDLTCAVREVYEETGYDIRKAGHVDDDSDPKCIEITMREQNIKLFVIRGVALETQFEPQTRKEISKIEWFSISDLPASKASKKRQEGKEILEINANKFYMVAPFIGPLKKWISQQRKLDATKDNTPSPPLDEGHSIQDEQPPLQPSHVDNEVNDETGLKELPAISEKRSSPSTHLKQLLNINVASGNPRLDVSMPTPQISANKSEALLSLLRAGAKSSNAEAFVGQNAPTTPFEQPNQPQLPNHHSQPPVFSDGGAPFLLGAGKNDLQNFPPLPSQQHFPPQTQAQTQWPFDKSLPANNSIRSSFMPQQHRQEHMLLQPQQVSLSQNSTERRAVPAPYHRTSDPDFAVNSQFTDYPSSFAPPGSQLPPVKLNAHTLSLLNTFKSATPSTPLPPMAPSTVEAPGNENIAFSSEQKPLTSTIQAQVFPYQGPSSRKASGSTFSHQMPTEIPNMNSLSLNPARAQYATSTPDKNTFAVKKPTSEPLLTGMSANESTSALPSNSGKAGLNASDKPQLLPPIGTRSPMPASSHQAHLLDLFRKTPESPKPSTPPVPKKGPTTKLKMEPVELSANETPGKFVIDTRRIASSPMAKVTQKPVPFTNSKAPLGSSSMQSNKAGRANLPPHRTAVDMGEVTVTPKSKVKIPTVSTVSPSEVVVKPRPSNPHAAPRQKQTSPQINAQRKPWFQDQGRLDSPVHAQSPSRSRRSQRSNNKGAQSPQRQSQQQHSQSQSQTQISILARPTSTPISTTQRSPEPALVNVESDHHQKRAANPHGKMQNKPTSESTHPFKPQILRRPAETLPQFATPSPSPGPSSQHDHAMPTSHSPKTKVSTTLPSQVSSPQAQHPPFRHVPADVEGQKSKLLGLFRNPSITSSPSPIPAKVHPVHAVRNSFTATPLPEEANRSENQKGKMQTPVQEFLMNRQHSFSRPSSSKPDTVFATGSNFRASTVMDSFNSKPNAQFNGNGTYVPQSNFGKSEANKPKATNEGTNDFLLSFLKGVANGTE